MTILNFSIGDMRLSNYAKEFLAAAMYGHGKEFIGAAVLLQKNGQYSYVMLYLLCQGLEIILKAVLLHLDYDQYESKLRSIGHDLIIAADAVCDVAGKKRIAGVLRDELSALNRYYLNNNLRYGSLADIFIDPRSIDSDRVFRKIGMLIKYMESRSIFAI